jgi:DNA-binding XRE family transcriptional regulator
MPNRSGPLIPVPVTRVLGKLGADIRDARRRRRIPTAIMAQRASISRTTLAKVEKGDPGVQLGIYAAVLFVLGLTRRIGELADVRHDEAGLALEAERLPQRIRLPSSSRGRKDSKTKSA